MDSRDEELTIENVDEQVARVLERLQTSQSPAEASLNRAARNLQVIFEEKRRVERVWERINSRATTPGFQAFQENVATLDLPASRESSGPGELATIQPLHLPGKVERDGNGLLEEHLNPSLHHFASGKRPWKLRKRRNLGIGLVAALVVITLFATIFAWPMLALRFHGAQTGGKQSPTTKVVTPKSQVTMKEYLGAYFKIQYPADWIVAGITEESTASYLQTVQFRPTASSPVEINVSAMPDNGRSIDQLLAIDPHVKLGKLESTRTVTYRGISWAIGVVDLPVSSPTEASKLEIAYSRQNGTPYRVELGATSDTFGRSSAIFETMLVSLYPRNAPGTTPTSGPSPSATPGATAPAANLKVYIGQYFKLEYPANWVITSDSTGGTSRQMLQMRPSATSQVFVNIDVMYANTLSASQLLSIDPDVNLGVLVSTSTVTYHKIPWSVGIVRLTGSLLGQPSKLEVAYSNQNAPYKLEFSAPASTFATYASTFTSIFASFYPAN
ncbi:MAG TPA: hypothetical protein VF458_08875 [Ktedonobacteraceae bacterium]